MTGGHRAPLQDIRILAVEQYGAGPYSTFHLAALGAEVIKVEDPATGGDVGRYVPPFQSGTDSLFFETFNANKRSILLDITNPAGRQVFEDLVGVSDGLFSNLRGDVVAKLGLRYDDVVHANPRIACVSLSGFGMSGPRSAEPAYDYILQGMAGWMSLTGEPDGPPAKSGLSLVDYSAGLVGAVALLAAVHAARRDGKGRDWDLSLFDTAISMLTYPATWYLTGGFEAARLSKSAHPSIVPFQAFQGSDGRWFVVACAKEKFWNRLASLIDVPGLAEDARFTDFAARSENRDILVPLLEEAFRKRPAREWVEALTAAGVPSGPVNTVAEAMGEPHTSARRLVAEVEHPRLGPIRLPASPVRPSSEEASYLPGPLLGGDGPDILSGLLGYDVERMEALAAQGAFGAAG